MLPTDGYGVCVCVCQCWGASRLPTRAGRLYVVGWRYRGWLCRWPRSVSAVWSYQAPIAWSTSRRAMHGLGSRGYRAAVGLGLGFARTVFDYRRRVDGLGRSLRRVEPDACLDYARRVVCLFVSGCSKSRTPPTHVVVAAAAFETIRARRAKCCCCCPELCWGATPPPKR
jgi:hypothetical protein